MTIEFEFGLRQKVRMNTVSVVGTIDGLHLDAGGKRYLVKYLTKDGAIETTWVYESEIQVAGSTPAVGK